MAVLCRISRAQYFKPRAAMPTYPCPLKDTSSLGFSSSR